jgi:hypothetical protein
MRAFLVAAILALGPTALAIKPASLAGTWSSPRCGERGYERRIPFAADGTFRADDRISPCPKGVACVWSGIITRRGTYAVKGAAVKLTFEDEAGKAKPLPRSFGWRRGVVSEGSCAYQRYEPPLD